MIFYTGLAITCGAIFGALLRYGIASMIPLWGIVIVNIVGCFCMGIVLGFTKIIPPQLFTGITTGFLGSFTTLSAMMGDSAQLILQGHYLFASCLLLIQSIGGLIATCVGMIITSYF